MEEMDRLLQEIVRDLAALKAKVVELQRLRGAAPAENLFEDALDEVEKDAEPPPPEAAPEESKEPAKEPAEKPSLPPGPLADFVASLDEVRDGFLDLPVDPKDLAFTHKVGAVLVGFDEDERAQDKGSKVLFDCLKFLDRLHTGYDLPPYADAVHKVFDVAMKLLSHLETERGFEVFPRPFEEVTSAVRTRIKGYDRAVKEHRVFDSRPEGTIVGVLQHGALLHGKPVGQAKILVSRGEEKDLVRMGRKALLSVLHEAPKHGDALYKAADEVRKLLLRFGDGVDDEGLSARYILNIVHEHNHGGSLKRLLKEFLEYMRRLGYVEIIASVGKSFDESYSPSKYERRKVRASEPGGQIVAILRRGFLDRNGVPVQKALVAVSEG